MVVPSVHQQLAAIRHTIAKTIVPALAADADFEREQAGLVLAGLDWAMDVVEHEHRYELVEHADYRALLAALREIAPDAGAQAGPAAPDPPPDDLPGLRARSRELKLAADARVTALGARGGADASAARALLADVARRQTARELAWTRMTGFAPDAPAVADVLADQTTPARP